MYHNHKNNSFSRIFLLMTAILLMFAMTACQSETDPSEREIKIGVVVYDEYDTFISKLMDSFMNGVSEEIKKDKRITVKRYNAAGSQITQNEQVDEMIEKGCNVICVNLVDRTDPSMIIESARKANVPVIFFNRELVEKDLLSWDKLYYVGADALQSGVIQGQIAADLWNSDPSYDRNGDGILQYVVLEGEAGHQDAIVRTESCGSTLVENGIHIEKWESAIANWNRAQAQSKMNQLINKYDDSIEFVLCNNDDMALGAIDEYRARNIPIEDRPVILGIDGTDVGLEAILSGEMAGTVNNDKNGQADAMLHLAIAAVTGEGYDKLPLIDGKYIRYPYEKITMDNVHDFITEE